MNVLVTGGGGFLGTYIVKALLARDHKVTSMSRQSYIHLDELGVKTLQVDISDLSQLSEVDLNEFDAIIHTAAFAGVWGDKDKFYKINYEGSKNIFDLALKYKIKYFIYTSSPSVVFGEDDIENGDETIEYPNKFFTDYAKTKAMAEQYILNKNNNEIQCISIRPHLIWGPGDPHLIPRIIQKARRGKLKQVGTGENLVDIIYVENAALAHVNALEAMVKNPELKKEAYFVGQETPVNLWEFINQILQINKIEAVGSYIDFKKAFYLGYFLEFVFKIFGILKPEPPMTRFVALQLAKSHYFSHKKAENDFNYLPQVSIKEGLEKTFLNKSNIS